MSDSVVFTCIGHLHTAKCNHWAQSHNARPNPGEIDTTPGRLEAGIISTHMGHMNKCLCIY